MDSFKENIKMLLDKYWAGESSLEEETTLLNYFNQSVVDEEFKVFQPLFNYFERERSTTVDLEDQVMERIQKQKLVTKVISMQWKQMVALAASFLLLLSLGIFMYQTNKSQQEKQIVMTDTFQSPEEALAQTKAALLYLSNRMNKAADKATKSISKTENLNILN